MHLMHSKWLDFATEIAAFHYQSEAYDLYKPPAFGAHPDVKDLVGTRERERTDEMTKEELVQHIEEIDAVEQSNLRNRGNRFSKFLSRLRRKNLTKKSRLREDVMRNDSKNINKMSKEQKRKKVEPKAYNEEFDEDGNPLSSFKMAVRQRMQYGYLNPDNPPLFLEETAHLLSLMSAVAMSTLRNDLEEAESPLIEFLPNAPWPHVDPDSYSADVRKGWSRSSHSWVTVVRYLLGVSRNDGSRTLYVSSAENVELSLSLSWTNLFIYQNAARPFRVIGNVSDAEIELLQAARGPQAKVSLCSMWLQEFLSREYLNGSTGNVAPPIISRVYQFISEGMSGYNQARKVAYIPFPFPHAQITTLFVLVIVGFIPVLMLTFLADPVFGFILNLITVMCFTGLHEVARELENPFQNVPNDIPLNNFQAQFNEALMVMFFGYHPDAYWQARPVGSYPLEPTTEDPVDSTGMVKVDHDEKDEGLESANHAKLFQNLKEEKEVEITFSPMETQKEGKESMSRIEMPLRDEDGGEDLAHNVEILRGVEDNSKTEAPLSPLETLAKGAEAEAASEPEGLAPEKIDDP